MMRRHDSRNEQAQLCGPGCRYRSLYEGAQASLADMAGRQATALNKHGRLRAGVVTVLRSALPRQFGELEHRITGRVSDVGDAELLSYAAYLLETSSSDGRMAGGVAGMDALRGALRDAGFTVPSGFDMAAWAQAVADGSGRVAGPAAAESQPAPGGRSGAQPEVERGTQALPDGTVSTSARARNEEPREQRALPAAGDKRPAVSAALEVPAPTERSSDGQPKRRRTLASVAQDRAAQNEPLRSDSATSPAASGSWMGEQTKPATVESSGASVPASNDDSSSADAADINEGVQTPERDGTGREADTPAADAEQLRPEVLDEIVVPQAAPGRKPKVVRPQAVRPELFPGMPGAGSGKGGRRSRKKSRMNALPPDPVSERVEPTEAANEALGDDVRNQLLARIALPRPVFTSDLVGTVASEEVISQWQDECRGDREGPVRFVPGKRRHRTRGSLVLPQGYLKDASTEFKRSCWAEIMTAHSGARLFELAVLLHSRFESVVSHHVRGDGQTVRLLLNDPRGLVGVIAVCDGALDVSGATRAAVVEDVEELMKSPLQMLVVLACSDPHLAPLNEALADEAAVRTWEPPCAVVTTRSWEYADNNMAVLKHILG